MAGDLEQKRSAKAGGARRSQERGPGWSEPRDTRAAIAAPWVAVEGFGTMDLKVTAFDAVLYEGASRGIPTTKLHSMYSRKLAAGAAVGAGHSNLYVCALPRDITDDADVPGVSRTDLTRCRVYVPAEPVGATGTALHWLKLGRHNVVQLAIVTFHRCRCWANRSLPSRSVSAEGKRRRTGVPTLEHLSERAHKRHTPRSLGPC